MLIRITLIKILMELFDCFCENGLEAIETFGRKLLFKMLKSEFLDVYDDRTLMTWTLIKLVFKSKKIDLTTISESELFSELKSLNPTLISRPIDHWDKVLVTLNDTLALWLYKNERNKLNDFTDYIVTVNGLGAVC